MGEVRQFIHYPAYLGILLWIHVRGLQTQMPSPPNRELGQRLAKLGRYALPRSASPQPLRRKWREAVMHGLEVIHAHRLEVLLRRGDAAVPKDFGEVKQIPACAEVAHRKCV